MQCMYVGRWRHGAEPERPSPAGPAVPAPPPPCSLGATGNEALATAVCKWAFQERGVLRATNLSHTIVTGSLPGAVRPELYRVNDDVEFSVNIQECIDGVCGPYK